MATPTADEKFKILEEKVNALPEEARGDLQIRISKKDLSQPAAISAPRLVCTLSGAALSHIVTPELWLPQLMGGGKFSLDVYLPTSSASPVMANHGVELAGIDEKSFPDLDVVDSPSWKGPKKVIFPIKQAAKPLPVSTVISALPQNVGTSHAPQTSSPGTTPSGGVPPQYVEAFQRMQAEFAAQTQALQQQIAEERRRAEDERHKRELEAIRAAQQAEMAAIKNAQQAEMAGIKAEMERLKSAAATPPPPTEKQPSLSDMIRDILPAAAPFITAYISSQAEERRRAEERQARAEERTAELIKEMRSRPAIDPIIEKMMERLAAEQQPATALVQQSLQGQAAMLGQMVDVMKTVAEMSAGPEETPGMKIFREAMGAFKDVAAASAQQVQPRARRLPKNENGGAPPPSQSQAPQQAGLHGYEPTNGASPSGILARLREMLTAHEDPDKVAQAAIQAFATAEFQKALRDSDMDANRMFENLMTTEWVTSNSAYAMAFGQAFMKQGMMAGIIQGPDDMGDEIEDEAA